MASKPKLKPCPFCGGEAQLLRISKLPNGVEEWFVSCGSDSCDLYPHSTIPYASAEIAAAAWNRRAVGTPSNAAAMRETLEYLCSISDLDLAELEVLGKRLEDTSTYGGGLVLKLVHGVRNGQKALAAPPRNCDKMPDIDRLTMNDLAKSPCKSTLECASREELLALVRWLLAPAKKGGAC